MALPLLQAEHANPNRGSIFSSHWIMFRVSMTTPTEATPRGGNVYDVYAPSGAVTPTYINNLPLSTSMKDELSFLSLLLRKAQSLWLFGCIGLTWIWLLSQRETNVINLQELYYSSRISFKEPVNFCYWLLSTTDLQNWYIFLACII